MQDFTYQNKTKIIFGRNKEELVGKETGKYTDKVLLHYGGGSIKKYATYEKVINSLKEAGISIYELGGVEPNPRLSLVKEGIEICRQEDINFILAVGGGSVIDSAKAISAGVPYSGDVWDFYTGKARIEKSLPSGVILTIPAAGSESSPGSVITKMEDNYNYKRSVVSNHLRPEFSILNPELTFTLPDYQTVCGAADIISHIMERYFSNTPHVELTDRLCESTMKTVINNIPLVLKESENYPARAEIMWASTIAHNDLLGTGREEDWASHAIEHELSAIYDIPHGAGLAVIFPAWMQYVYKENVNKFARFAVQVWNIEANFVTPEKTALEGIKRIKHFFSSVGLPVSLKELDIPDNRLEEMAVKCTENGPVGNFMKLDEEDVLKIYKLAR